MYIFLYIAFLLFLTYFGKVSSFGKVDNTIFLSKILFYFAGMIFFCSFTSPVEDDKGNKHTSTMTFVKQ